MGEGGGGGGGGGGGSVGFGGAQVPLSLHQDYDIHTPRTSCITLIDAPSIIHKDLITSQGVQWNLS